MSPLDLIRSRDGSMSLTKLAAATAHALAAVMFVHLQWGREYIEGLWLTYLGITVIHAGGDKFAAMVKDFKDRKLNASAPVPSTTTTTETTTTIKG
jgi:peptidyl-tRNA hydrolase